MEAGDKDRAARAHATHEARIARLLPVLRDRHGVACFDCRTPSCCYEVVPAYVGEAELAIDATRAAGIDALDQIATWAAAAARAGVDGPEPDRAAYFAARLPCPLLGMDGRCTVYAARPLACRSHFVRGDPAACALPYADRPDMRVIHVESRAAGVAVLGEGPTANFAHLLALRRFNLARHRPAV